MAAAVAAPVMRAAAGNTPLVERETSSSSGLKRGASHYDLEYSEGLNERQLIVGFITKVYGILGVQILYTTGIIAAFCFVEPVQKYGAGLASNGWFGIGMIVLLLPTLCAMMTYKDQYPKNGILLTVFTTIMAGYLGCICAAFVVAGQGTAILSAAAVTALIFFSLTAYVWYSDVDFSFMGGFLFVALVANMVLGLFAMIFAWPFMIWMYHIMGVLIFSGYILYDTDQIVNKVRLEDCDTGTAMWGALELYLDLVNLFLHLLALFGDRN